MSSSGRVSASKHSSKPKVPVFVRKSKVEKKANAASDKGAGKERKARTGKGSKVQGKAVDKDARETEEKTNAVKAAPSRPAGLSKVDLTLSELTINSVLSSIPPNIFGEEFSGPNIVDIGAGYGVFTKVCLDHYPGVMIDAFECDTSRHDAIIKACGPEAHRVELHGRWPLQAFAVPPAALVHVDLLWSQVKESIQIIDRMLAYRRLVRIPPTTVLRGGKVIADLGAAGRYYYFQMGELACESRTVPQVVNMYGGTEAQQTTVQNALAGITVKHNPADKHHPVAAAIRAAASLAVKNRLVSQDVWGVCDFWGSRRYDDGHTWMFRPEVTAKDLERDAGIRSCTHSLPSECDCSKRRAFYRRGILHDVYAGEAMESPEGMAKLCCEVSDCIIYSVMLIPSERVGSAFDNAISWTIDADDEMVMKVDGAEMYRHKYPVWVTEQSWMTRRGHLVKELHQAWGPVQFVSFTLMRTDPAMCTELYETLTTVARNKACACDEVADYHSVRVALSGELYAFTDDGNPVIAQLNQEGFTVITNFVAAMPIQPNTFVWTSRILPTAAQLSSINANKLYLRTDEMMTRHFMMRMSYYRQVRFIKSNAVSNHCHCYWLVFSDPTNMSTANIDVWINYLRAYTSSLAQSIESTDINLAGATMNFELTKVLHTALAQPIQSRVMLWHTSEEREVYRYALDAAQRANKIGVSTDDRKHPWVFSRRRSPIHLHFSDLIGMCDVDDLTTVQEYYQYHCVGLIGKKAYFDKTKSASTKFVDGLYYNGPLRVFIDELPAFGVAKCVTAYVATPDEVNAVGVACMKADARETGWCEAAMLKAKLPYTDVSLNRLTLIGKGMRAYRPQEASQDQIGQSAHEGVLAVARKYMRRNQSFGTGLGNREMYNVRYKFSLMNAAMSTLILIPGLILMFVFRKRIYYSCRFVKLAVYQWLKLFEIGRMIGDLQAHILCAIVAADNVLASFFYGCTMIVSKFGHHVLDMYESCCSDTESAMAQLSIVTNSAASSMMVTLFVACLRAVMGVVQACSNKVKSLGNVRICGKELPATTVVGTTCCVITGAVFTAGASRIWRDYRTHCVLTGNYDSGCTKLASLPGRSKRLPLQPIPNVCERGHHILMEDELPEMDESCKMQIVSLGHGCTPSNFAYHVGPCPCPSEIAVPHSCRNALLRALRQRQLVINKYPTVDLDILEQAERDVNEFAPLHKIGVPLTVNDWLDNEKWPKSKRDAYSRAAHELQVPLPEKFLIRKTFVKMEAGVIIDTSAKIYKERVIQGAHDMYQVYVGPTIAGAQKALKECWSYKRRSPLVYVATSPAQLAEWISEAVAQGMTHMVESDFSAFDSTEKVPLLEYELRCYDKLMQFWPDGARDALHTMLSTVGFMKGSDGTIIRYTCVGRRRSGDSNTSCGNTAINGCSQLADLRLGCNVLHILFEEIVYEVIIFIHGDDMLLCATPRAYEAYCAGVQAHQLLGLEATLVMHADHWSGRACFLQNLIYLDGDHVTLVLKPGRILARGWIKYVNSEGARAHLASHGLSIAKRALMCCVICDSLLSRIPNMPVVTPLLKKIHSLAANDCTDLPAFQVEQIRNKVLRHMTHELSGEGCVMGPDCLAQFRSDYGLTPDVEASVMAYIDGLDHWCVELTHEWFRVPVLRDWGA